MNILIKSDGTHGGDTGVYNEDGTRIRGVTGFDIHCRPNELVTAELQFEIPFIKVHAELRMQEDKLRELVEAHGFAMVPK